MSIGFILAALVGFYFVYESYRGTTSITAKCTMIFFSCFLIFSWLF